MNIFIAQNIFLYIFIKTTLINRPVRGQYAIYCICILISFFQLLFYFLFLEEEDLRYRTYIYIFKYISQWCPSFTNIGFIFMKYCVISMLIYYWFGSDIWGICTTARSPVELLKLSLLSFLLTMYYLVGPCFCLIVTL